MSNIASCLSLKGAALSCRDCKPAAKLRKIFRPGKIRMENFAVKRNQSSVCEFVKVGGEVEREVGRALVGHRVCHSEGERLHFQPESERETGKEVALVGRHVGTRLVVVPESRENFSLLYCRPKTGWRNRLLTNPSFSSICSLSFLWS